MGRRATRATLGGWVIAALGAAGVIACSVDNPESIDILPGHGPSRNGPDPFFDAGASGPTDAKEHRDRMGGGGGGGGGGSAQDSGPAEAAQDVLADLDAGPNVFGTTPYKSMPVATSAKTLHGMKGASTNIGAQTPCLSCHGGASMTTARFLYAGSIYTDMDATAPAPDIEVAVVDSKGASHTTYSDSDGNFWLASTAALKGPGFSGARNAITEQTMTMSISSGDCNSCHNGTTQAVMHLP